MDEPSGDYRRLVYTSRAVRETRTQDLESILHQARFNNGLNGLSGLLYAQGGRYVQVLEGTPEAVEHVFDRIRVDARHQDVTVVSDEPDNARAFGGWTMANLPSLDDAAIRQRLGHLLAGSPPAVREVFASFD